MQRILVAGSTGAGKTTLARALAEHLAQDVSTIISGPCWIFDSFGYPQVRDPLWSRADTIVWLDYTRSVVMRRVLRRSAARMLLRRQIFGGNVETVASWFSASHPAWWAWAQYTARRAEIASRCASAQFAPLDVFRLTSPRVATEWLGRQ
jgi:energy-coupling factor transporter ATP-binding protein EcfA2